jgi:hypothetical protein
MEDHSVKISGRDGRVTGAADTVLKEFPLRKRTIFGVFAFFEP